MSDPPVGKLFYLISDMASLIAMRVRRPEETLRQAKDKVRKRLMSAVEQGDLAQIGGMTPGTGLFFVPQVVGWARSKWPGAFLDLPAEFNDRLRSGVAMKDSAKGYPLPGDIDRCHEALMEAYREIGRLESDVAALAAENGRLALMAAKYEAMCEKNARSAKGPRKER